MKGLERKVVLCQSAVRGFLVRRRMTKVRQEFQRIAAEIEGVSATEPAPLPASILASSDGCGVSICERDEGAQSRQDGNYPTGYQIPVEGPSLKIDSTLASIQPDSPPVPQLSLPNFQEERCLANFQDSLSLLSLEELEELKVKTAFELLWIQDSVLTRKDYLRS